MGKLVRAAFAVVFGLLMLLPGSAFAQANWDGSESTTWDDPDNWVGGTTPTPPDNVFIDTTEGDPPYSPVIDSTTTTSALGGSTIWIGSSNGSDASLSIINGGNLQTDQGIIGNDLGSTGSVTVSGTGSAWGMPFGLSVGNVGTGTLMISDGGDVFSGTAYLGLSATGYGSATVTGVGSTWYADQLRLGNDGTGELLVSDGGWFSSASSYLGFSSGSSGTATITGAGSSWFLAGSNVYVGFSGDGELLVSDGGLISSGNGGAIIGQNAGSTGALTITGAGSTWSDMSSLIVGGNGSGTFMLSDGATVSNQTSYIGQSASGTGEATVTGIGTQLNMATHLYVGQYGTGELTIADGASVSNATSYVGLYAGSQGTATVTGADSLWSSGSSFLGYYGTGNLTIEDGGQVNNVTGYLGYQPAGSGTALVTGADSLWSLSSHLYVGNLGAGNLTISNGGVVSNSQGTLGYGSVSSGTAIVTGVGSQWTNSSSLYVGLDGEGNLTIEDGGAVSSLYGYVGSNATGDGTVMVTGAGSSWTMTGDLRNGYIGAGEVTVADGAAISSVGSYIGQGASATGTMTVTGAGSQWTNTGDLNVGFTGSGDLTISDGGVVSNAFGRLGANPTGIGSVIVTGAGSIWTSLMDVDVGFGGLGTLDILDGGVANSRIGLIASSATGVGNVLVSGVGSQWNLDNTLYVGASGDGEITITDGGVVNVNSGSGIVYMSNFASGDGTLNIGAGAADAAATPGHLNASAVTFLNGAGALVFNHTDTSGTYEFAPGITSGAGTSSFDHLAGYTRFTGDSSGYTGDVNVHGGTMAIENLFGGLNGFIADTLGDVASVIVAGSGAEWNFTGDLILGGDGAGTMTVSDGGIVSNAATRMAFGVGSTGDASVSGAGSEWNMSSNFYVGYEGDSELMISNGGVVSNLNAILGRFADGNGDVLVTGAGSQWNSAADVFVGFDGTGLLTISDGGVVSNVTSRVGLNADSVGDVIVSGAGSVWDMSGNLFVGYSGDGELTISDGGVVNNEYAYVGRLVDGNGVATVTGAGSQWNSAQELYAGFESQGALNILDGGVVTSSSVGVGSVSGVNGEVLVDGGALNVVNGVLNEIYVGQGGNGTMTVSNGGTVQSGTAYVANNATSSGAVTVTGTGSRWDIDGVSAQDAVVGGFSEGSLTIADGGVVDINDGAGDLDLGYGGLGTGTLNIGGASGDAAVVAGTLSAGVVDFGDGTATLVFNHTDMTETYAFGAGLASGGTGSHVVDHYAGYTRLTGDSSAFGGTTTIYGGTLAVENALGGMVDVLDGGTLGGSGAITGTVNIGNGAVLAPGSSIGTMQVVGNVVQAGGSTFEVEVDNAGNGDFLDITGSYTIDPGATLSILPENGTDDGSTYGPATDYTIVTATGGVTGTFDTVLEDFLFLEAFVDYDANNVYLTLEQIYDFIEAAITPNEHEIAGALDNLPDGDPVKDAMLLITSDPDAADAFAQLSGEIHPSLRGALRANDGRALDAVQGRLRMAGLSDENEEPGSGIWATGFGNWRTSDATPNTHELGNDAYGLVAGVDRTIGEAMRLGVLGAYTSADASSDAIRSDADVDSYTAGLYGGTASGQFVLDFGALYSWHNVDTARRVNNPLNETLTASYNARSIQLFGEAGIRFGANQVTATPFAGIAYGNVETDDFAEHGGDAALMASSESMSTTFATVGVRPAIELTPNMRTRGMIGWRRTLGDLDTDTTFSFDGVNQFRIAGAPLAEDSFVGEFGFDVFTAGGVSIGASYVGEYGDGVSSNGFDLRLRSSF